MAVPAIVFGAALLGVALTSTMDNDIAPVRKETKAEEPKVEKPKEPLPPGWTEETDASGDTYYVSPKNHSQWERPTAEDEKRKEAKHKVAEYAQEVAKALADNRKTKKDVEEAQKVLESARSAGDQDLSVQEGALASAKEEDKKTLEAYNTAVNNLEDAETQLKTVTGARRVQTFRRRSKRSSKNERQRLGY